MKVADIKPLLRARHMSHAALAGRLGISRVHVTQMLNGKKRMNVDTMSAIEAILVEPDMRTAGVAETRTAFGPALGSLTLEEARQKNSAPRMSAEERERWLRELRELGEAAKRLPRITDMTDDEILGYDEME